ncbi:csdl (ec-ygdl) protein of the hesa/moeb/thif family, part of the csda-e-l sulfur transfer pathway [hydrocarbon metagenome]|uniref:Csdl (Ec-ygdl) protein of the hesa/moeb/thif family, part of the csda-e-l sulfur transfer pathway n=1 Tax=hydrocarbon metagenome TaxID=938273 RepID=A0A0W8E541_9ZZZZ
MDRNDSYFHRTQLLVGEAGMEILNHSRITIIGVGGVGSHAVEALCRCGVGNITIVDPDRIEESNINRQIPALSTTIGRFKTEVMAERMQQINPFLQIHHYPASYTAENSAMIAQGTCDYVIDAIDSLKDKIHLIKTCLEQDIPIISSMGTANRINPQMLKIADIKDTSICPVARKVRRELREYGIHSGLTVVYSQEIPLRKGPQLGSIVYVTATAGLLLAAYAVNSILGLDNS